MFSQRANRAGRRVAKMLTAVAFAASGLALASGPAQAADTVYAYPPAGWETSGHAGYKYSTNHGWTCDDLSDGQSMYAVWYFSGGANGTEYRANAPAHNDGCKDNFFDKKPTGVSMCVNINNGLDECHYRGL
ncbi:hypothetical protein OG709_35650 (plasmid) [Streptomyces sp. NBC_01267]|uniref:hypothetical protein n=1 Tax=Streptomyces sp. NBC_01267 TaxID=2903805 RepID=UPI002E2EF6CC|nr:hypothetical protein [Streptomyces sp. NBC_01267]